MADLFNTSTLMLCLFAGCMIIALFFTGIWIKDRGNRALLFWTAAFWGSGASIFLLALRGLAPDWLVIGIGNMGLVACMGLLWLGFQAFDRRPLSCGLAMAGAAVWAVLYFAVPFFSSDINTRIIVVSVLISVYSLLMAKTAWEGRTAEPLPARTAVAVFFSTHALIYIARVPLTLAMPVVMEGSMTHSLWFGVLLYELFIHAVFSGIAVFAMLRERMELQYKTASETDALTEVLNRRAFMGRISASRHNGRSCGALALMDIDHFKSINDGHGHGAGDAVLFGFCRLIETMLPAGNVFGRIGGEEFGIYLPRGTLAEAEALCEAIRRAVERLRVADGGNVLGVTVSIGLCPVIGSEIAAALTLADKALYASKRGGRNQVTALDAAVNPRPTVNAMPGADGKGASTVSAA